MNSLLVVLMKSKEHLLKCTSSVAIILKNLILRAQSKSQ